MTPAAAHGRAAGFASAGTVAGVSSAIGIAGVGAVTLAGVSTSAAFICGVAAAPVLAPIAIGAAIGYGVKAAVDRLF